MKRILIANDLLYGGGVETILDTLVRYLVEQDYEVSIMIPNCSEAEIKKRWGGRVNLYSEMRTIKHIKRFTFSWFIDRILYVIQRFLYKIKFFLKQFDVIVALKEGPIMQELAGLYGKKKIAWVHTDYNMMHWTKYCFRNAVAEKKCMKKYDKIVCVSYAVMNSIIQEVGDPGNLCVRYSPVNYQEIRTKAEQDISEVKNVKRPLLLSVGRLSYPKNYSLLIDICYELSALYSFEVWIIGDGSERQELQEKISNYNLNCVKLLGEKTNPFPYLMCADLFISTSLIESYGLAIQEALILGKPVIAMNCPAIEESFDERWGQLCSDGNKLKENLENILCDLNILDEYSTNIKKYYQVDELFEKRLMDIVSLWGD